MKPTALPKSPFLVLVAAFILFIINSPLFHPLCPATARAAESPEPFETMSLGATFLANVGRTEFNDYWNPSNGVKVAFGTPFYLGAAEIGVHVFQNDNVTDEVPVFRSTFVYLGWGYEWRLPFGLGWYTGVQTGGFYMNFDDDDVVDEGKTESELGLGFQTNLRYPTAGRWSVLLTGEYRRIYTYRRIDYAFLGVGVSYTMTTPRWLRGFLE